MSRWNDLPEQHRSRCRVVIGGSVPGGRDGAFFDLAGDPPIVPSQIYQYLTGGGTGRRRGHLPQASRIDPVISGAIAGGPG